jgi:hypothetical protein
MSKQYKYKNNLYGETKQNQPLQTMRKNIETLLNPNQMIPSLNKK